MCVSLSKQKPPSLRVVSRFVSSDVGGCGGVMLVALLLLLSGKLLFQTLWHFWRWWSWKSEPHFDTIIDEPLQSGQCTDHDDTREETFPDT